MRKPVEHTCSHCGKHVVGMANAKTSFYKSKNTRSGFGNCCKECQKKYVYTYAKKHRKYFSERASLNHQLKTRKISLLQYATKIAQIAQYYGVTPRVKF